EAAIDLCSDTVVTSIGGHIYKCPRRALTFSVSRRRVLELSRRFEGRLARTGQDQLSALQPELGHWDGDIMTVNTQEPADPDDGVGNRRVRRDNDVVHANSLSLVIEDGPPEDLTLRTPTE